ncbi:hypothetical protein SNEBB_006449 [Seison nebaliae]|nr:hypothetical protein SNEBB_006449 [Seison nebaliae]
MSSSSVIELQVTNGQKNNKNPFPPDSEYYYLFVNEDENKNQQENAHEEEQQTANEAVSGIQYVPFERLERSFFEHVEDPEQYRNLLNTNQSWTQEQGTVDESPLSDDE